MTLAATDTDFGHHLTQKEAVASATRHAVNVGEDFMAWTMKDGTFLVTPHDSEPASGTWSSGQVVRADRERGKVQARMLMDALAHYMVIGNNYQAGAALAMMVSKQGKAYWSGNPDVQFELEELVMNMNMGQADCGYCMRPLDTFGDDLCPPCQDYDDAEFQRGWDMAKEGC